MHTSNIIWNDQAIFSNIYIYMDICECNTYMCATTKKEKEAINLKESEEGYMEVEKGKNKCCNYVLFISQKKFDRICIYDSDLNWPL